jgi:hypothetical protein
MGEDTLTVGEAYAYEVLKRWVALMEVREKFRGAVLSFDEKDQTIPGGAQEVINEYISRLTSLWGELHPYVKARKEFGEDVIKRYEEFSSYFYNPRTLMSKEHIEDVFKLDEVIREVLHLTKITQFEKV